MDRVSAEIVSGSLKPVNCCESGRRKTGRAGSRGLFILKSAKTPDDLEAARIFDVVDAEVFAHRVLIGKESLCKGLVDDGDPLRNSPYPAR